VTQIIDDPRQQLLNAAMEQLTSSVDGELSTRAICAAVGVSQPVLYRIFRDKQGLLDALVAEGLARYTERKAGLETTPDPVADLATGWDDHIAFARENPELYRLMFAARPAHNGADSAARNGVLELLKGSLRRCASAGALLMDVDQAAAVIFSANIGLALNILADPETYGPQAVSNAMRSALFSAIVNDVRPEKTASHGAHNSAQNTLTQNTPTLSTHTSSALAMNARTLAAQLDTQNIPELIAEERALLRVWLGRLSSR